MGGSDHTEVCSYIKIVKSEVKSSHHSGRLAKLTIYFLQLIFNVRVHNRGFWQLRFDRDHFNDDSENSFSVNHDSTTLKMVDHGVTKTSVPISETH